MTRASVVPLAPSHEAIRVVEMSARVCAVCGDINERTITLNAWVRTISICVSCGKRIGELANKK